MIGLENVTTIRPSAQPRAAGSSVSVEFVDTRIRRLVEAGRIGLARKLAGEGPWAKLLRPATVRTEPASGRGDLAANHAWIVTNRARYSGRWVALRHGALVANASSLRELRATLFARGNPDALLTRVP